MRKLFALAACAPVLFGALGIAACGGENSSRAQYHITAEYFPEERLIQAEMTALIPNDTDNALHEMKFELYPNAYREGALYPPMPEIYAPASYYNGDSYGNIEVLNVEGASSFSVGGADRNVLTVTLDEPLYPDERAELGFTFEVELAEVNHRLGAGENTVALTAFYPMLCPYGEQGFSELVYAPYGDPFVTACADYSLTLTVPEGPRAAYGGTGTERSENGKTIYEIKAENAREIAVVLGEFESVKRMQGGVEIAYYYYDDGAPEYTLDIAERSLTYFSETFGKYIYPRYTVVQTDFPYGGMEYPMLSMISSTLRMTELPAVVAHETAHQWWYAMVGSDQYNSPWQDEGLAEYSTALFLGEYPEYGSSYEKAIEASEKSYRAYFSVASQLGSANALMNRPLTSYSGVYEYRCVAYDKGVILFDRVRMVAGERKFFSALKKYFDTYCGKTATTADLISSFDRAGANVEGLFDSFTEGRCVI